MSEANLTRFGPRLFELKQGAEVTYSAAFNATVGPAKLILQSSSAHSARVKLNGKEVLASAERRRNGQTSIPVDLKNENTLDVKLSGEASASGVIRIAQSVQADIGLLRQGYFGLNTSDMAGQRAFYETLGFKGEIYPAGPETSTTFARALGFEDDYLIYVALTSLENPPAMPFVDTVQFRGDSYRSEPPYAKLNHIGMAYATYSTTDLDGDCTYLTAKGVEFVSATATAPYCDRFVFFKDQDGAFLKLVQADGGVKPTGRPSWIRLVNTNMNVSDLERSREFYRMLGFTHSAAGSMAGGGEFAKAHGFDEPIEFEGEDVSLGEGTDGATLQLRQWKRPYDGSPPYPPPVNHLGIDRINFYVKDLNATIDSMKALGFEPVWPIGGGPDFGLVFFFDPDGIKVQLAGPRKS